MQSVEMPKLPGVICVQAELTDCVQTVPILPKLNSERMLRDVPRTRGLERVRHGTTSQDQQALAASCRDCSAAWLSQEQTRVFWCRDCTEAFRQDRQAPAVSCTDCTAAWLLWERIRIAGCTDYIAAARSPTPNSEGIEKAQLRTLACMEPGSSALPIS